MLLAIFGIGITELIILGLCCAVPVAAGGITLVAVVLATKDRREPPS